MDNKEAIKNIKDLKKWKYLGDRKYMIALDKAIASLEAWDKVIKELEYFYDGKSYYEHAIAIIRKHLKEIEE